MRFPYVLLLFLVVALVSTTGCAAVAGIFKAGVWVGIIVAVVVIGSAVALFSRFSGS
jgi:hypothetical protein